MSLSSPVSPRPFHAVAVLALCLGCSGANPSGPDQVRDTASEALGGTIDRNGSKLALTPFGAVDAACVTEVEAGALVLSNQAIQLADKTIKPLGACTKPAPRSDSGAAINGWVEYAEVVTADTPSVLSVTWTVPEAPSNDKPALIYFFPSFEPADGTRIVQPVLQYGQSPAGGGQYWAIASWYVTSDGHALHSKVARVNPGDTIVGTMTASCGNGCTFNIVAQDATTGAEATLSVAENIAYPRVQAGVLEAYGVSSCDQMPASSETTFTVTSFADQNGNAYAPSWAPVNLMAGKCSFGVSSSDASSASLFY